MLFYRHADGLMSHQRGYETGKNSATMQRGKWWEIREFPPLNIPIRLHGVLRIVRHVDQLPDVETCTQEMTWQRNKKMWWESIRDFPPLNIPIRSHGVLRIVRHVDPLLNLESRLHFI